MRSSDRRRVRTSALRALLLAALLVCSAHTAAADRYVGAAAGVAIPYNGQIGWTVLAETGKSRFGSDHFRTSTEFEFRRQTARPQGAGNIDNVPMDIYYLRLLGRFFFAPGEFTPYFGAGGGLSLLHADATSTKSSENGLGGSIIGLLGVEMPVGGPRVRLYGETRFGYTWDLTGDFSNANQKGFDGFTGVAGLRFWF